MEFQKFILDSKDWENLKEYIQSYTNTKYLLNDKGESQPYHTYTCSLSSDCDSLLMWNTYASGSEGVNIGFTSAAEIFNYNSDAGGYSKEDLPNGIIASRNEILYEDEDKKACIALMLKELNGVYEIVKKDLDEYRGFIFYALNNAVNNMRCFFKNKHFSSEKEYRFVLHIPEQLLSTDFTRDCNCGIIDKGFFKRGNILIPYVDYELRKDSIERIVISPFLKNEIFKIGLKELLRQMELTKVEIDESEIPEREYS